MVRSSLVLSLIVAGSLLGGRAEACEGHAKAAAAKTAPAPAAAEQPETKLPASSAELLRPVDVLVADKCSCTNAADCTCKKGQCKCKRCKPKRMADPVKGQSDALQLPTEARLDASVGVFI